MYYVFLTLLLAVLIASLGVGFALGSRLPELDERQGERRDHDSVSRPPS